MRSQTLMVMLMVIFFMVIGDTWARNPVKVDVPVVNVYIPRGFDSNDNVELIVMGNLPNLCHKYPETKVEIKGTSIYLSVQATMKESQNPFCPQMLVPFLNTVSVGQLKAGTYKIYINRERSLEEKGALDVNPAQVNSTDDHIYAQINYVEIDKKFADDGSRIVYLNGYIPSDCLIFDHVEVVSNGYDTYAILPIMKQIRDFCPMKLVPLRVEVKLPSELKYEGLLLHVRSMEGQSVNTIYYQD